MRLNISNVHFGNSDINKNITIPEKLTLNLSEETGLHIGDGSMNFYRNKNNFRGVYQLRGHLNDDKAHYNQRVKNLYKLLYNFYPSLREMKSSGVYGFQIWSDALVNFKNKVIGLPLGEKTDVKIPKQFFIKKDNLISLIRGIFDTDGCVYIENKRKKLYPRVEFKTISNTLAEQLKKSLNNLDLRATKYSLLRTHKNWHTLYTVSIRGEEMVKKTFKIIQPNNPKHKLKFNFYLDNF